MRFAIYISRHDTEDSSGRDYYSLLSVTDTNGAWGDSHINMPVISFLVRQRKEGGGGVESNF